MIYLLTAITAMQVEGEQHFVDLLPALGLIILLVAILIATIYYGRRLTRRDDETTEQPFTLQSLRDLHARGELSDKEFQRAKDAMIGQIKAAAEAKRKQAEEDDASASDAADERSRSSEDEAGPPDQADNEHGKPPKDDPAG